MVDQPTPPPHVRHAEKAFEDALKSQECRKRLKQAAVKVATDARRLDKEKSK